jgi:hypothetical protein
MNFTIVRSGKFEGALRKAAVVGFSAAALVMLAASAHATNLVSNGTFTSFSTGTGGAGQFDQTNYTTLTSWGSTGYNFLFTNPTGTVQGVDGALTLDAATKAGPVGNFIGLDGAYDVGAVTQTIGGLIVGVTYTLNFYWAASQQTGYTGGTTDFIAASLGSTTHDTATVSNPQQGFTGWTFESFNYTATATSEVLSFLATGTPSGVPPFALISDVSLTTPEPGTLTLMLGGLGLLAGAGILRSKKRSRK